jgi:tRNA A37 N6-isopentenylltransferase MiaA
MKLDTRHYAKRQWTWWRAQSPTVWLDGFGGEPAILEAASRAIGEIDASLPGPTASGTAP